MQENPRSADTRLPRRGTDRLEDVAAWLLVAVGLLVVVLAGVVAMGADARTAQQIRQESADRTQVAATALHDTPFAAGMPGAVAPLVLDEVSWTGRDGQPRTGTAKVPSVTRAGQPVTVWVDTAGNPVDEPADISSAAVAAITGALVVLMAGGTLLVLAWAAARHGIGVLNARQWEREWAQVGPKWTGHGGQRRHDVGGRPAD